MAKKNRMEKSLENLILPTGRQRKVIHLEKEIKILRIVSNLKND
jgi:hypothetical protein